jgi:hypothetical protein
MILPHEDAGGNSVRYEEEENHQFAIRSAGPDGQFDTPDDLVLPSARPNTNDHLPVFNLR